MPQDRGGRKKKEKVKAIDTLLDDQAKLIQALSDRLANLEANEGPASVTLPIVTLYDNTLSGNGSWDVQNSDLIAGVGNFVDYDMIEIILYDIRSTAAGVSDNIYLLFGTGVGALDTTVANYSNFRFSVAQADTPLIGVLAAAGSLANAYSNLRIETYFPSSAHFKDSVTTHGTRTGAATHSMDFIHHNWENTGTITRIGIRTDNNPTDLILSGGRMIILGHLF